MFKFESLNIEALPGHLDDICGVLFGLVHISMNVRGVKTTKRFFIQLTFLHSQFAAAPRSLTLSYAC